MLGKNTEKFVDLVGQKDLLQRKYLIVSANILTDKEKAELEAIIDFYLKEGYQIEYIAECYRTLVKDTMKEQMFFLKNNYQYRYDKFEDVADDVYYDKEYMQQYMIGLGVSQYIWRNHIGLRRWFEDKFKHVRGENYLEIGPGHGNYFVTAMQDFSCARYDAVDISETSVELTKKFIKHTMGEQENIEYTVKKMDFFELENDNTYDIIVMGEVLEHVQAPLEMLKKIKELAKQNAMIFVSTVINAPEKDHIYLFKNKEEVFSLCKEAGLNLLDYKCFTANDIAVEQAEESKAPIIIGTMITKN